METTSKAEQKPKKTYRYCIVPFCENTTLKTPDKIFFWVPKETSVRSRWWVAMLMEETKAQSYSPQTKFFCCEDHFNLQEDAVNFPVVQNVRPKLKPGVVPRFFDCQRSWRQRYRPDLVTVDKGKDDGTQSHTSATATSVSQESCTVEEQTSEVELTLEKCVQTYFPTVDKSCQVNLKPAFRSKGINTKPVLVTTAISPIMKPSINASTSPFKKESIRHLFKDKVKKRLFPGEDSESSSTPSLISGSDYRPEELASGSDVLEEEVPQKHAEQALKTTTLMIEKNPKLFLGLPINSYHLIRMLSVKAPVPYANILVTLRKLRLNESFEILGLHFSMSKSNISRIFRKTVFSLATLLQELIVWPDHDKIRLNLPIPFRARYGKVVSIIDCFEIEIEKPTNPLHQALTWSQYKSCNTIKYLISCTPDGLVNFISCGYGGRASDVMIMEDCGFLDKLPPNVAVMADRGFKNIAPLLHQKNCTLVRPPSVMTGIPNTKQEVKESKRIAALRIHVERVIGRLREFDILLPHCRVDNHLIPLMDYIVIITCAIINLQSYLIKSQI